MIYITSSLAWRQRITTIRNLMELKVLNLLPRSNFFTKAPMFCSGSCLPMSTGIYGYCILLGVAFLIFAAVPGVAGASATLNLAWDKSTSADVAGYQVHYGTSNRNYRHTVDVHKNISCSVSGLEEGETYFFAVTAYDRNRIESDYSNEVAYAIPYPSTPDTAADTDNDGILDSDEISIYETDPTIFDSDKDGLDDGKELAFWGADWRDDPDKDGLVNLKDHDSDGDGYTDGYEISNSWDPADPSDHPESSDPPSYITNYNHGMEAGIVTANRNWSRVNFKESFLNPIVVAKTTSLNNDNPVLIRISNIDSRGFDIRLQQWDYQYSSQTPETVSYFVLEKGHYMLEDGTQNRSRAL